MPGLNRTGPMGQGPMTGRRTGRCTNFGASPKKQATDDTERQEENPEAEIPESNYGFGWGRGPGFGRGRGMGPGRGRGFGPGWNAPGRGPGCGWGWGLGRQNHFRGGF